MKQKKNKYKVRNWLTFVFVFLLTTTCLSAQGMEWLFNINGNSLGWTLQNNLSGSVSNCKWELKVLGTDPYFLSPDNLNISADNINLLELELQNYQASGHYQIFWTTVTDNTWTQNKSISFSVGVNESAISLHSLTLNHEKWKGTIKQVRIDPGDGVSGSIFIKKISFSVLPPLESDNGILHVKLDMTRGGAISYISQSGSNRSLVNIADEGRYIQQSYYAGQTVNRQAEGQQAAWSPWSWNPIQVGDAFHNRAQILSYSTSGNTLYVKCIPMLWDMNNRPAEAEMEQWTTLNGNSIHVKCRLTCHRTDNIYIENVLNQQELPAVYPISALKNLYTYTGNSPFTNDALNTPATVNLSSGFWGVYENVSEHWMAFVDNNYWGMGVYNARCLQFLAGMAGQPGYEALDGSTSYIAPLHTDILNKNSVYEYEYDLIIGTVQEIRQFVYNLQSVQKKATQSSTEFAGDASKAIDGNTDGNYANASVTHTQREKNPWWTFDRTSSQLIEQLKISNRTECCTERLHDFYVFVSDNPFTSDDPATTANTPGVWSYYYPGIAGSNVVLNVNRNARYIRVQIPGENEVLSLAEIELTSGQAVTPLNYSGNWDFSFSPEGWNLIHSLSGIIQKPGYGLTITSDDPYMLSPDHLNVSASEYNYLTIRIKNSTSANVAELFWITDANDAYEGTEKHIFIPLKSNDDGYTDYIVDLSKSAGWTGTIRQLRLDPSVAGAGTVGIDYISLTKKGIPTGIGNSLKNNLPFYHNPFSDVLTFDLENYRGPVSINIIDMKGSSIYVYKVEGTSNYLQIKLEEGITSGLYLMNVITDKTIRNYKLQIAN